MSFDYGGKRSYDVWFYEGPSTVTTSIDAISSSGSINTSMIDAYRQGVEMTQINHWTAGIVKIHAGEPNHVLRKNSFGIKDNSITDDNFFKDLDYFDPVKYMQAQVDPENVYILQLTYPIVTSNADQSDNYSYNGAVEPLTIRGAASFFSLDVPFEAKSVKGSIMAGNLDHRFGSDIVTQEQDHEPNSKFIPFLDTSPINISGVNQSFGYFFNEFPTLSPFVETVKTKGITVSNTTLSDSLLSNSVLAMTSSNSDTYVTDKSSCTGHGFMFDNAIGCVGGGGVDSIAFGGMSY